MKNLKQQDKTTYKLLIISIVTVSLLSIGLFLSNSAIIISVLMLFTTLLIFSSKKNLLPLLLFFLPWSPVLKISPSSFTLFTLVMPLVFLVMLYKNKGIKIQKSIIIIVSFFVGYTLIVKIINNLSISPSYLYFVFLLLFLHTYTINFWKKINFEICVLFMTVGTLSACFASNILMKFPQLKGYINVYQLDTVGLTRLSGFYGDSNFYAAQIIMAIALLLTVLIKSTKKSLIALEILSILLLIYFGLLSVSKMFLICLAFIILLWVFLLLFAKRHVMFKLSIVASILFIIVLGIYSNIFTTQIDQYTYRFTNGDLTTGRTTLQKDYIDYFITHIDTLFLGVGFSKVLVNSKASHNTFIQIIWQIGIIGGVLLFLWRKFAFETLKINKALNLVDTLIFIMILSAYFFPWFALDYLYFDEFFYYGLLVLLGKKYLETKVRGEHKC